VYECSCSPFLCQIQALIAASTVVLFVYACALFPFRIRSDCVCRCKKRLMEDEGKSDLGDEVSSRICVYVFDAFEEEEGEGRRTRVL
jgi:hypothetical protein